MKGFRVKSDLMVNESDPKNNFEMKTASFWCAYDFRIPASLDRGNVVVWEVTKYILMIENRLDPSHYS